MEEWKEYKLGDLIVLSSGGTPNKSNSLYWGGDIPWISAKAMYDDYLYSSDITITREGLNNGSKLAPVNSILLLTRGSGLFNRIPVCLVKREMAFNQDVKCIESINQNIVSTLFLFYWLMGNKQEISNILETTGIGAGKIDTERLKGIHIKLPPFQIQQVLIKFAESLMLKIEVNRRINDNFYFAFFEVMLIWLLTSLRNDNLEQQAQALFNSWFVDFEPFRDHPFVESELGMIPKGWRVGTLNELGDVVGGSTPSKAKPEYYTNNGIAWLTPKDLSISQRKFTSKGEIDITQEGYESCSTKLMPKGSVLFSSRAPIGYITIAKNDICTNQGFKSVIPKFAGTAFLYCFLKESTQEIENKATGSTFKEASGTLMKSLPAIIPEKAVLDDFENLLSPLFCQQEVVEEENTLLSSLRDSLLPRLMSGELNVSEINV